MKPTEQKKIIKTFRDLSLLDQIVGNMYAKNPKLKESKFGYAYQRFFDKNNAPTNKLFKEKLTDIAVENALEDKETKAIIHDKNNIRGFAFSKEGLKKVLKQERELQEEFWLKDIEVEPYISSYVPENLTEEEKEALKDILI